MIDTVVIRLNNISHYNAILNNLINSSKQEFAEGYGSIPKNSEEALFHLKINRFEVMGKQNVSLKGEVLTSSHYSLHWTMPTADNPDYVEFNFSVPKLLYGTNVIQFVQHATENSKLWDNVLCNDYSYNQKQTYERFVFFVRRFFEKHSIFADSKVKMSDVEIRRIDICHEQLFNSKTEAMEYMEYQKSITKKHLRITSDTKNDRKSSVFFSTKDYGAKIYHKGLEYCSKKGEKKRHKEINRKLGKKKFDTDAIQNLADRILRYEITFRSSYMSKIFRNKVFRRKNKEWQKRCSVLKK